MASNRERIAYVVGGAVATGLVMEGAGFVTAANPNAKPSLQSPVPSGTGTPIESASPSASESAAASSLDLNKILASIKGDAYFKTVGNWHLISDHGVPGAVMDADKLTGKAHLVSTLDNTVGQAYWDANVPGPKDNQAISLVLAHNVTMPVEGLTEWGILPGQTPEVATQLAFDGQVKLEADTQPKVCTMQVDESAQATADVVLGEAPQWEALKIPDAATAAKSFGRDAYSMNPDNWESVDNGFGWKLKANKDGSNSIVEMTDQEGRGAVGLVYWDVKNDVSNGHNVVAGVLAPHTMALVREVTVYAGVPAGMEKAVTDYAFLQARHLEFNTQEGVWVIKVTNTVCPAGPMPILEKNAAVARATAEIANSHWYDGYVKQYGKAVKPLTDGTNGIVITEKTPVTVTLSDGQVMNYWDGKASHTVTGPLIVKGVLVGTIYPHK